MKKLAILALSLAAVAVTYALYTAPAIAGICPFQC